VLGVVIVAPRPGDANVSLKNGNFFIGYTDIIYSGGFGLKIERVYNAKSGFKGIFGFGWGNEYEAYVSVSADGSVVIHEYGSGAENAFVPEALDGEELRGAVEAIVRVATSTQAIRQEQVASYRQRLETDASFRNLEWEKFRDLRLLSGRSLPVGAVLVSNRFGHQYIKRVRDGYVRVHGNGRSDLFGLDGRLRRVTDKNENFIDFVYDENGRVARMTDDAGRTIRFTVNSRGLVEALIGENQRKATYEYNDRGDLIKSTDVDNNVYEYEYDDRHNMTTILYTDKTRMEMTYYSPELHENIRTVRDRDGTITRYTYVGDPADRGHFQVVVDVRNSDGAALSRSAYEYYIARLPDGIEWTKRLVTDLDGEVTDTTYNPAGRPVRIVRGGEETTFRYDGKGRLTYKETASEVSELEYHPIVGKVTQVRRASKVGAKRETWSRFRYDDRGNLVFGENSEGQSVTMTHDDKGRILEMDSGQTRLRFVSYNRDSKPTEIKVFGLGSIRIEYTEGGAIKKVESDEGRKIAVEVSSIFQRLLGIIRPASVSLSF
jgi:YD repeat-containing protein